MDSSPTAPIALPVIGQRPALEPQSTKPVREPDPLCGYGM